MWWLEKGRGEKIELWRYEGPMSCPTAQCLRSSEAANSLWQLRTMHVSSNHGAQDGRSTTTWGQRRIRRGLGDGRVAVVVDESRLLARSTTTDWMMMAPGTANSDDAAQSGADQDTIDPPCRSKKKKTLKNQDQKKKDKVQAIALESALCVLLPPSLLCTYLGTLGSSIIRR